MNSGDLLKSVDKIFTVEELKKEIAVLAKQYKIESAYLFGSYARGGAMSAKAKYGTVVWSEDIDIALEYLYECSAPAVLISE